ncbi:hypothetical protein LB505_003728 [Fusarium chuoi]|nr:hypothetical protein LB505_003728 [Fusarium chuoi]
MAFNFLCAFPTNFGSLLVGRFLAGVFISAPLSTTPGVLVDLWDPIERGNATGIFSLASWVGPSLGPVVSGFVQLKKNWRWGIFDGSSHVLNPRDACADHSGEKGKACPEIWNCWL